MVEEAANVEETVQGEAQQNVQETIEQQAKENQAEEPAVIETKDDDTNITTDEDGTIKIDLRKQPKTKKNAVQEQSADEVPVRNESETSDGIQEKNDEKANETIA